MLFQIKICGITNSDDALAAVDAGAHAIGLNFYRSSKRCITAEDARRIVAAVGESATKIGVFVNEPAKHIREICGHAGLHCVQLHGDEPPEFLKHLSDGFDIIRARRLDDRGLSAIADDMRACRAVAGSSNMAVLIDAAVPGEFGGTGRAVEWTQLASYRGMIGDDIPLILAGGLTPDNVAEAIRIVRPDAVDVASGVESAPGKKDPIKIRDFIAAARAAFCS